MNIRSLRTFLLVLVPAVVLTASYHYFVPYSLAWNTSESIPRGLYLARSVGPTESLEYGQPACFEYQAPAWASARKYFPPGTPLCKYVYGQPGDGVAVEGRSVFVLRAGVRIAGGELAEADSKGRPLSLAPGLLGMVPVGELVLLAPAHKNSLDSRYLGRISRASVTRVLFPLATY